jgi:hypothetical protein
MAVSVHDATPSTSGNSYTTPVDATRTVRRRRLLTRHRPVKGSFPSRKGNDPWLPAGMSGTAWTCIHCSTRPNHSAAGSSNFSRVSDLTASFPLRNE